MPVRTWAMLAALLLHVGACGSPEQPPAKPPTPTAAVPAPPTPPAPPVEPAKPAAAVAEAAKAPAQAAKAAGTTPAQPAKADKAAVKTPHPPDTIILAASQGQVPLPHLVHAKLFPCATCHGDGTPGKVGLTKDAAHDLCRDCHTAKGAGPTGCTGCHKK